MRKASGVAGNRAAPEVEAGA
uniref:Multi-sensor hybrid histidine kinase n=1 Tax=Lysobacter sp. ATCC 53042 TaxID=324869 RepID=F8TUD2_9GAMM|nr:multi-sensor hybrid histidine kinase [Lysobacter sp. ATCC 53042]